MVKAETSSDSFISFKLFHSEFSLNTVTILVNIPLYDVSTDLDHSEVPAGTGRTVERLSLS